MMKLAGTQSIVATLLALSAICGTLHAQTFPARPITIVVPYAAGGATDITARRLGESLARVLSNTVLVGNRPGAATTIAAAYVARSPRDGYTLLMAPGSTTSVNPYLFRNLPYRTDDFAPVSLVSTLPFVVTAAPGFPPSTIAEFIAYANSKSGGLTYGTTGAGSMTNIIGEWIGRTLGVKLVEVPYKGTAPATIDLIGGRLDISIDAVPTALPMVVGGKIRVLAVMADARSPLLPDVPTFRESGFPDLLAYTTFGLLAPAGTPEAVINAIHRAFVTAVATPEFSRRLAAGGETAVSSESPKQFQALLLDEYEKWGRIVKPLNLKLD